MGETDQSHTVNPWQWCDKHLRLHFGSCPPEPKPLSKFSEWKAKNVSSAKENGNVQDETDAGSRPVTSLQSQFDALVASPQWKTIQAQVEKYQEYLEWTAMEPRITAWKNGRP